MGCGNIRIFFREYFGKVIPVEDNTFAALNSAVWSGGVLCVHSTECEGGTPTASLFPFETRQTLDSLSAR
jgi:Fe-S cluster assembly scaffold protein SufB